MKFEELMERLEKGETLEEVCVRKGFEDVECIGNEAYDDQDLYDFLESIGAEIIDYRIGHVVIKTENGNKYTILCVDRPNRFDPELPDETILVFDANRVVGRKTK